MSTTTEANTAADGSPLISFIISKFPFTTSFGDEIDFPVSGSRIAALRKAARA